MMDVIGFVIILAIIVIILALLKPAISGLEIEGKPILTDNEKEFFHRLQRSLPDYHVFPQVAVNAILQVSKNVKKARRFGIRNRFSQLHVDYLICEKNTLAVMAVIELDDRTHKAAKDAARDRMLETGGYRVIRFASKRKPAEAEIAALFTPSANRISPKEQF